MWNTYAACNNCGTMAPNPRRIPSEWVTLESRPDGSIRTELPKCDPDELYAHHYHYCPNCVRFAVAMEYLGSRTPHPLGDNCGPS